MYIYWCICLKMSLCIIIYLTWASIPAVLRTPPVLSDSAVIPIPYKYFPCVKCGWCVHGHPIAVSWPRPSPVWSSGSAAPLTPSLRRPSARYRVPATGKVPSPAPSLSVWVDRVHARRSPHFKTYHFAIVVFHEKTHSWVFLATVILF